MSNSADSLKKKVCVTVFLDELFEEVHSEEGGNAEPINNNSDPKFQNSKTSNKDSEPQLELGNNESPTAFSNPEVRSKVDVPRPRKHRRESKFSKNPYKLLKTLKKYSPGLESKRDRKNCKSLGSPISDSDLDNKLDSSGKEKTPETSQESFTTLSEIDCAADSNLPEGICSTSSKDQSTKNLDDKCSNNIISFSSKFAKSTQVDNENKKTLTANEKIESGTLLLKREQKDIVENPAWRKTQKCIQLMLENVKNRREISDGDRILRYNLRSISEECEKTDDQVTLAEQKANSGSEDWSTDFYESDTRDVSDSYTCIFPHNRRRIALKPRRRKRVFAKKFWSSEVESDMSELEYDSYQEDIRKLNNPYRDHRSLLCYTSYTDDKKGASMKMNMQENGENIQLQEDTESISLGSSISRVKTKILYEQDEFLPLTNSVLTVVMDEESIQEKLQKAHGENNFKNLIIRQDGNFTQCDEEGKNSKEKSENFLPLQSNEKLLICKEILNRVPGKTESKNKKFINSNEIEFLPSFQREKDCQQMAVKRFREVFIQKKSSGNQENSISETESETIFPESMNSSDFKDFEDFRDLESSSKASLSESYLKKDDVCVLEFNDEASFSKLLKNIKTVEIVREGSKNFRHDTKNLGGDIILICENPSNEDFSMDAWQSSVSTIKSLSEVGQCYLKDSRNSSMYLIEIPFQFRRKEKRQRILD